MDMLITLLRCTTITLGLGEIFVVNCSKLFFPTQKELKVGIRNLFQLFHLSVLAMHRLEAAGCKFCLSFVSQQQSFYPDTDGLIQPPPLLIHRLLFSFSIFPRVSKTKQMENEVIFFPVTTSLKHFTFKR